MSQFKKNKKIEENLIDTDKKNIIKNKLMKKYNVSPDYAEKILVKIQESGEKYNLKTKESVSSENYVKLNSINSSKSYAQENSYNPNINNVKKLPNTNQINNKTEKTKDKSKVNNTPQDITGKQNEKNVDEIIYDLIPNSKPKISVELKNVDLTYEVENDRIETLKEKFIKTIKREKSEKIKIHALNDISFKIYRGEKVGIIGHNGAGKSTLLNVIVGVYSPDKGTVNTYGAISPLLSLGAGFDRNYSGRKNIFFNGAVLGYDKNFLKEKEQEIIDFSELGDYIDIPIKNYSSGMLAKLGFSIATLLNPDILIIDEILGVGDVNFAKKSADKIKSLMDGKTTVILVSHAIPQIKSLCDKAIWIDNGCVKEIGDVNTVCDNYIKFSENATKEQLHNIQLK